MAASPDHGLLDPSLQGIHVPYQWAYANAAARSAATGFVSTDVGKLARQTDDNSFWVLTVTTPTWVAVGTTPNSTVDDAGWVSYSAVSWVYSSADGPTGVFTVAGVDLTTVLTVGTKVRLTQTTVKYFIVTAVSFSTNTTVTIYGGTDYTLANAAISVTSYSRMKAPSGFNIDPDKWTESLSDTSAASQSTPTSGTWYNLGTLSKDLPIGLWYLSYEIWLQSNTTAAQTSVSQYVSLSTANNSESDTSMTAWLIGSEASATITLGYTAYKSKILSLAAKTTYYLVSKTIHTGNNTINFRGDISPTIVRARCAYL